MNNEIRLSLSGAREDDSQLLHIATEGSLNQLPTKHRNGWTPAPTKPAYSQTNVNAHLGHKGRDYDAILRAAKKAPVGYWEDAPMGIKFGGGGNTEKASGLTKADTTQNATAPTTPAPPPPQQSTDGPWPKWLIADTYIRRFDGPMGGCVCYHRSGNVTYDPIGGWDLWSDDPRVCSQAEATQWLEQNGHKDVAAQLRGKAATGGGRVWTGLLGNDVASKRACVLIGGIGYCRVRGNWHHLGEQKGEPTGEKVELFGPERDAILAECRKAMGLDTSTVRVTISTAPRADVDCKTRCELKQAYVKIEMATGLIIPCDETDPDKIGYVR